MRDILVAAILAAATPALADPPRHGFMIGASLGAGGATACDGCERLAGGAAELHIGGWLTPQWALSYEVWVYSGDPRHLVMDGTGVALATVTTRVAQRVWIKEGVGLALYEHDDPIATEITGSDMRLQRRGFGLGTGVGYELYQSPGSLVVDLSARTMVGLYPDHGANVAGSVLLGVSWN